MESTSEPDRRTEHHRSEGSHVEHGPAGSVVEHPTADDFGQARVLPEDPTWYKHAVFYEVLVRAFYDSNADGIGDLRGLTEQLDYLKWLGVDCLWLPPFYDSPLRDGGYDIRDFYKVLPEFGTVDDFVNLLDAAHRRGIRIITDLVMNHTSDTHPWFEESRRDPDGPYGDFYVWSDTAEKYSQARIIFVDTEESNWTFDPVRRQFYWHRFFSHQPDLNYDNPAVQEAMLDVLRFWLDLGIDGFRLDAVPYLFEREGTNCENLPETHAFLKRCRKVVDDEYPGRVLLAEANQWPADVVAYFGDPAVGGDECHMAFHFPLMPRIFMAVRRESRFPISEILAQTPDIPETAQWGIFLRNHDELTLEMVNDEERDYMYAEYAKDPRMKANVGIRRRLAPLLENDRNQIELFTALLLSLPGSPVIYYGDEIGMSGGKDPDCRRAFPWSQDAWNMEVYNWVRLLIRIRKSEPALRSPEYAGVVTDDAAGVYAYRRGSGRESIVVVLNNSGRTARISVPLGEWNPLEQAIDLISLATHRVVDDTLNLDLSPAQAVILKRYR